MLIYFISIYLPTYLLTYLRKGLSYITPDCPGTCLVDQADLELRESHLPLQVLGLKVRRHLSGFTHTALSVKLYVTSR